MSCGSALAVATLHAYQIEFITRVDGQRIYDRGVRHILCYCPAIMPCN